MRNIMPVLALAMALPIHAASWSGWRLVEGGGITDAAASATVYNGSMYLFAKGKDAKLYVNRGRTDGSGWGAWTEVAGAGYTNAAPASAAHGGNLYLFAPGIKDHAVYVNKFNGKAWSGWSQLPGGGLTDVALTAATHKGEVYLFGKGLADHKVYVNKWSGKAWTGWSEVPGGGYTDAAMAATSAGGKLHLFARGIKDRGVYVNTLTNSWSGWQRLGTGTTRLGLGATTSGNTAWVVAVDDAARHIWTSGSTGGAWSAWSEVPGGGITDAPVAAITSGGKISLFARGVKDGRIYVNTYQ
ncbi:MAG TPA: hypothetical protein VKB93_01045 [Thermoanaerobaculia bacterium]|nr:hypothetical protein [Thermoanaerobaculia bacterium]